MARHRTQRMLGTTALFAATAVFATGCGSGFEDGGGGGDGGAETPSGELTVLIGSSGDAETQAVEEAVAAIWAELLEVERVGVHDGFFDRGGHSLLVMRLVAKVRGTFGVELAIGAVFAAPTVEGVAAEIERLVYEEILALPEPDEAESPSGPHAVAGD